MSDLKKHNESLTLYMLANGLLSPPALLGMDSIQLMVEGVVNAIKSINAKDNYFEINYCPTGLPKIDGEIVIGCYTVLFLIDQFNLRGSDNTELENLSVAIKNSSLLLKSYKELDTMLSDTKNIFDIFKNIDSLNRIKLLKPLID
jgi:hypothetical protein